MEYRKGIMKASLAENLRSLMIQHIFEKITIKQICNETGVIRATFYNYFDDKYDCLNWIVYHDLCESILQTGEEKKFRDYLDDIFRKVDENRDFYSKAYNVTGQNSFEEMVRRNLALLVNDYFKKHRRKGFLEKYSNENLARYYAECVAINVRLFVQEDSCGSAENAAQMTMDLLQNSFFDFTE
jgi:probable dihydroxyacetone kinase regulator